MTFATQRLRIEPLRREHAPALFGPLSDPRLYLYMDDEPPSSVEALGNRYGQLEGGAPAGRGETWLNWAVRLGATGEPVGTLQATLVDLAPPPSVGPVSVGPASAGRLSKSPESRSACIAYVVTPAHWGRGYALEGTRWLLDHLAREHGVTRLSATADTRNEASWRLLERLGFERAGEIPIVFRGQPALDYAYRLDLRGGLLAD